MLSGSTESPRAGLLDEAKQLICGDRNAAYGPPTQDFARTAALWSIIFEPLLKEGVVFDAHHVAMAMIQLKQSRLVWSPSKRDSWTDTAGYAGCGWEAAVEEGTL
jgi:hypothetical protein